MHESLVVRSSRQWCHITFMKYFLFLSCDDSQFLSTHTQSYNLSLSTEVGRRCFKMLHICQYHRCNEPDSKQFFTETVTLCFGHSPQILKRRLFSSMRLQKERQAQVFPKIRYWYQKCGLLWYERYYQKYLKSTDAIYIISMKHVYVCVYSSRCKRATVRKKLVINIPSYST